MATSITSLTLAIGIAAALSVDLSAAAVERLDKPVQVETRSVVPALDDVQFLEDRFEAADTDSDAGADLACAGHTAIARPEGASLASFGRGPARAALAEWIASKQRAPASL